MPSKSTGAAEPAQTGDPSHTNPKLYFKPVYSVVSRTKTVSWVQPADDPLCSLYCCTYHLISQYQITQRQVWQMRFIDQDDISPSV